MANESEGTVQVQAMKTFEDPEQGLVTPESKPFSVDKRRFAELKAAGLVEEAGKAKSVREEQEKARNTRKNLTQPDDPEAAKQALDSPYTKMREEPKNKTAQRDEEENKDKPEARTRR